MATTAARTSLTEPAKNFSEEDLVPDEAVLISLTQRGYIKRVAAKAFRAAGPRRARRNRARHAKMKMRC